MLNYAKISLCTNAAGLLHAELVLHIIDSYQYYNTIKKISAATTIQDGDTKKNETNIYLFFADGVIFFYLNHGDHKNDRTKN